MFCLPIVAAGQQAGPAAAGSNGVAGSDVQHLPTAPRCLGALLLSFASPAQLDAAHARNLLLLSRAVAPGLLTAAGPLLQQCALVLGVSQLPAEEGEGEEEEEGSVYLTESEEEEEGELPAVWEEEEAEAAALAEEEEALRQQQAQRQQQPQWAAGSCREQPPWPPEDPGSASAALAVQPQPGEQADLKSEVAAAAGERIARRSGSGSSGMAAPAAAGAAALVAALPVPPSPTAVASRISSFQTRGSLEMPRSPVRLQEARQPVQPMSPVQHPSAVPPAQPPASPRAAPGGRSRLSIEGPRSAEPQPPQEPESPSVAKAKAKAAAAAAAGEAAVAAGPSTSAAPDTGGGAGPDFSAPLLLKVSRTESEASLETAASAMLAREAGSSLLRLLRFEDPALEARFARWLHAQLWRVSCCAVLGAVTASRAGASLL